MKPILRESLREVFGRNGSHGTDSHIGTQRSFHEGNRESRFNLRENDHGREILDPVFCRIGREHRNPFHATNFLTFERRRETIDSFLGCIIEDLYNFFRKDNITGFMVFHGLLASVHGHRDVQATRSQQIFLRKIPTVNVMT